MRSKTTHRGRTVVATSGKHAVSLAMRWPADELDGLLGFAIRRTGPDRRPTWLQSVLRFPGETIQTGKLYDSSVAPIQSLVWSDHGLSEDTIILPGFEGHAPAEAHALGLEHAAIRKLLLQLGIEVELHLVRLETVKHLIDTLHAHAAREDAWMYPWAQVYLPLSARRQLFVRIGRSLRVLAALRARVTAPPPPTPAAG